MISSDSLRIWTLPLPEDLLVASTTYTATGTVLVSYTAPGDPKDFMNIAVVNDDGSCFRRIWCGSVKSGIVSNGIRFMIFPDGKRVHFGSWILECTPDIDHCETAELIPVEYPDIFPDDRWFVWTEIIVSPDNRHVSWTQLHRRRGSVNLVAELVREKDRYVHKDVTLISTLASILPDPEQEGHLLTFPLRGGEVKQFIRGGRAISIVGSTRSGSADSVIQDLDSEDIVQMTNMPGYDETTIYSPDEKLGLLMTTRFSPKTDLGVIGLVPRPPYIFMTKSLSLPSWSYSVAAVRQSVDGNVGPALLELDRVKNEPGYKGICLASPDKEWVYSSPMSWHPNGKKVMWMNILQGTLQRRARIAELTDYEPGEPVPVAGFPSCIPYGVPLEEIHHQKEESATVKGFVTGKHCGKIHLDRRPDRTESVYEHYSDDGESFWDGKELIEIGRDFYRYIAKVELTGPKPGTMDIRILFRKGKGLDIMQPFFIDHSIAEDGKPASYGSAEYEGTILRVEDLT